MTRSHDSLRELLAIHALDALEPAEAAEVEFHVAGCESCRTDLDEHRAVASLIGAQSVEADVPETLWHRVQTQIAPTDPVRLPTRRVPLLAAIGAAAAMLVLVVVQTARLSTVQSDLVATRDRLTTIENAVSAGDWSVVATIAATTPGARTVTLTGGGDAVITLLPDGTGFITSAELENLPRDRTYQLWIVQRGEVVSAGLLRTGAIGSVFRFDPTTLEGLVVTEEEAAGVVVSDGPAVAAWFDA